MTFDAAPGSFWIKSEFLKILLMHVGSVWKVNPLLESILIHFHKLGEPRIILGSMYLPVADPVLDPAGPFPFSHFFFFTKNKGGPGPPGPLP